MIVMHMGTEAYLIMLSILSLLLLAAAIAWLVFVLRDHRRMSKDPNYFI